jgi:L-amino acid N-acyltransferase YncA
MAPEAEGKGLAGVLWLTALSRIRAAGIRHASSRVSVNNVSSLNLFVRLEFKLKNPAMVMHLWHGSGVRS